MHMFHCRCPPNGAFVDCAILCYRYAPLFSISPSSSRLHPSPSPATIFFSITRFPFHPLPRADSLPRAFERVHEYTGQLQARRRTPGASPALNVSQSTVSSRYIRQFVMSLIIVAGCRKNPNPSSRPGDRTAIQEYGQIGSSSAFVPRYLLSVSVQYRS